MSIEIVYCLQSKQKRNEGKKMAMSKYEFKQYVNKHYFCWASAVNKRRLIFNDTGWSIGVNSNSFYCANSVPSTINYISKCELFSDDLDGFSYWDNAWWRTC